MEDDKNKPILIKSDASILAITSLVHLQEFSNTTCGLISDMLKDAKAGNNVTRSKLIEKLNVLHASLSSIGFGISNITRLNKKILL